MYKTLPAVFLFFANMCAYSQTAAFGTEVNPDGTGITIVGFKGNVTEITIPETIDGLPVKNGNYTSCGDNYRCRGL
jgi:hypothetical protein